jgi:N-acetylneuraminic acid mutarotase
MTLSRVPRCRLVAALLSGGALVAAPGAAAATISWTTVTKSPIKRMEAQAAAVGGRLYVFGGYTSTNWHPTTEVDAYDPGTNSWQKVGDEPIGRSHQGIATVGQYIYLAGGYPAKTPTRGQTFSSAQVWRFDTVTRSFSSLPPLPQPRGSGVLAVTGGLLHFISGADPQRQDSASHWVLNLNGGSSWTAAAPILTPRTHMCAATLGGRIYAVGGQQHQDAAAREKGQNEVFDPSSGTWSTAAPLPDPRSHVACFVLGSRLVVAGGLLTPSTATNLVSAYDPGSNSWNALTPLPHQRTAGVADVVDGTVVFATGSLLRSTWEGVVSS